MPCAACHSAALCPLQALEQAVKPFAFVYTLLGLEYAGSDAVESQRSVPAVSGHAEVEAPELALRSHEVQVSIVTAANVIDQR